MSMASPALASPVLASHVLASGALASSNPFQGQYTWGGIAAFVVAAATLPVVWALLNRLTPWNDHEEMFERGNAGFTVVRALQVVALAYAVSPVIGYGTDQWWQQAVWAVADAAWSCLLLALASFLISRVVRHLHGGLDGFRDAGAQVALVLGVFYAAFGQVIGAVLPGPGEGLVLGFVESLVFAALGIAYITVVYYLVSRARVFRSAPAAAATPDAPAPAASPAPDGRRNLGDLIVSGNWAATIMAAALVWAFGTVTSSAVAGDFSGWLNSILAFVVAAVVMVVLTILTLWLVDKFVITRETTQSMISKGQALPAGVMAAFVVAAAILASYVVSLRAT